MHAQHEGALSFGDIRFGALVSKEEQGPPPGSLSILSGAHSTYHNRPPKTRTVHGRKKEKDIINNWYESKTPLFSLSGIAGCGKTTLVSDCVADLLKSDISLKAMYYPCQPWDSPIGIATSLLHRIGISEESGDPYNILATLPYKPAAQLDIDSFRRRLCAHLLDEKSILESSDFGDENSKLLVILDDVHNIGSSGDHLFGALLQVSEATQLRLILISRANLALSLIHI